MFSGNQITSYINVGIIAFFVLVVAVEMLFGLKRGWKRQLLHFGFTALAFVCSFFVTNWLVSSIDFNEETVSTLLSKLESFGVVFEDEIKSALLSVDPELYEVVIALPVSTLVAPLLFVVLFFAANIILKLLALIAKTFVPKARTRSQRLIGMAVGFIEGAVAAALVLLPISAYSTMLDGAVYAIDSADSEISAEVHTVYDEYLSPISKNPILKVSSLLGGDLIVDSLATVEIEGDKINMRDEIIYAAKIIASSDRLTEISWDKLSDGDKSAITSLVESISASKFFAHTFSGGFKTLAHFSEKNNSAIIVDESDGELTAKLFKDSIKVLGETDTDTIKTDLQTIKEMLFILSDGNVIKAFNNFRDHENGVEFMIDVFNADHGDGTILTSLISTLRKNERTEPLVKTLATLSLSVIGGNIGIGEEAEELYNGVVSELDGINSIDPEGYSTDDEYRSAVSDTIAEALKNNGITVEGDILSDLTTHAIDLRGEDGNIDESDIQDVFVKYFESYKNN